MTVARTQTELRAALDGRGPVGFVPTMGALHEGHLCLIRRSASENQLTVCSVFVNPTQFGPGEDLDKYPRREAQDLALAASAGCDIAFLPTVATVYGGSLTTVHVSGLTERYEGAARPGHFDGVATVVNKLFGLVRPDRAYFGLKDLQQCAVVRRMVEDLFMPVDLCFVETVREDDGVAMSSRNAYLGQVDRARLAAFPAVLFAEAERLRNSERGVPVHPSLDRLIGQGFAIDYVELVLPHTMEPVETVTYGCRLVAAVRLAGIRFLDNVPV